MTDHKQNSAVRGVGSTDVLDWRPMDTAPKDASEFRALMIDGTVFERCHYAEDLSGSEQPPFRGWFVPYSDGGSGYYEIGQPVGWLPLQSNAALSGSQTKKDGERK